LLLLLALAAAATGTAWLTGLWSSGGEPAAEAQRPTGPTWFEDITDKVGLNFVHDAGPVGSYFMPQIMGSGAALFDFDNDGRLDIYLLQGAGPDSPARNKLFHQEKDGHFTDVSAGSGLEVAGYCTGVAVGDVNNDGLPDVLLTLYGGIKLFVNQGEGKFCDVTAAAGLETSRWATSAAFVDYDRDGRLDLVVVHYVDFVGARMCNSTTGRRDYCHPSHFPGCVTQLYHNVSQGLGGAQSALSKVHFEDVTTRSGLSRLPGPGLGVLCADFNGDGWPDLFIANDSQPNFLWINQRNGTFKEEAVSRGLAFDGLGRAMANMGTAMGDVDGDGLFDLFVTHLTLETHTLWLQGPRGLFHDGTGPAGLAASHSRGTGFGTVMADFDCDGWLDVAIVNGRVAQGKAENEALLGQYWSEYAEHNQLFANEGNGRFKDIARANPDFCGTARVWRSLAVGDIDGDGAPDLLATVTPARPGCSATPPPIEVIGWSSEPSTPP
jgi:hypothetical protein